MAKTTTKAWYTSTTMQGNVVATVGLLSRLIDLPLLDGEAQAVVSLTFGLVGLVMTIYGRIKTKGETLTS